MTKKAQNFKIKLKFIKKYIGGKKSIVSHVVCYGYSRVNA
jgi:hypothetical protein